jgi:hypothetical protein
METAIIKKELCPALTESEKRIVQATTSPKIKSQPKTRLESVITSMVTSVIIILGHNAKFSDQERKLIEREIVNDIFTNFGGLTYDELRIVFSLGARGEYKTKPDEVVYFSVASVYNWLKNYISKTKREAMQKQARFEQDQHKPKEPTEEEKRRMGDFFLNEYILKPYRHYLKTGEYHFDNRGNVIYNTLDKLGVIPFTVQRKKEIFERAKQMITLQMEQYPGPETKNRLKHIKEFCGEGHEEVVSKAKDLALRDFLKELKDQEMDLEEWIEMRRV